MITNDEMLMLAMALTRKAVDKFTSEDEFIEELERVAEILDDLKARRSREPKP